MFQRIQTVFILFAIAANALFFIFPVDNHAKDDPQQWIYYLLTGSILMAALIQFYGLLLYKNRAQQVKVIRLGELPQVVAFGSALGVVLSLGGLGSFLWDEMIGVALLFCALLFEVFAVQFIKKDIKLVKSMDRLRG
jgi:hypothetical protein